LARELHSVATPETIRESLARAGFPYRTDTASYILEFSKERTTKNRGFQEIWGFNIPLESLSTPRQNTQFGLVNQESM
jgi:hypothetical protein